MLAGLMGGLVDKEKLTRDTITDSLIDLSEEYGCEPTDLFIMIKPTNKDVDFKCWVYKLENGAPTLKREITLKEILDGGEST